MSTHLLVEVKAHFTTEMPCQMGTLYSETPFVEMDEKNFFKWFLTKELTLQDFVIFRMKFELLNNYNFQQ